jgi:MIP family channel proteins
MQRVSNESAEVRVGREASSQGRARTVTGGLTVVRPLVAEFIATFALVFVGVGAIVVSSPVGRAALVGVALAHGLVLATMVTATAAISGGHVNPAVTFGALIGGRIRFGKAVGYWIAQILGAIAGAAVIGALLPAGQLAQAGFGEPLPAAGVSPLVATGIEFVLTFFLVFVVFGSAIDERAPKVGGLFIGLTLAAGILVGGPLTGAALNPARFLGPAIVNLSHLQDTWIYLVGPLLGGAVAGLVWRYVFVSAPQTATA